METPDKPTDIHYSFKDINTFKSVKNNKEIMETKHQIKTNAVFRVTEKSPLNKKSIKQVEKEFPIKITAIYNPSYSYSAKKVVGKDIDESYTLQVPVLVVVKGDYDVVTNMGSQSK